MKKMLSLLLVVAMVCSMGITSLAIVTGGGETTTNDYTQGTAVVYNGTGTEEYTVTVPATMKPGQSGTVTLSGTWASNKTVKVTADASVTLTNSINANDQKVLNVTFAGIEKAGDNTGAKTYTETVSVAAMPADALFGTWSGKFNYNVEFDDGIPDIISFTIDSFGSYQAEEGMTWAEWVESDYNTFWYINDIAKITDGDYVLMDAAPTDLIVAGTKYTAMR